MFEFIEIFYDSSIFLRFLFSFVWSVYKYSFVCIVNLFVILILVLFEYVECFSWCVDILEIFILVFYIVVNSFVIVLINLLIVCIFCVFSEDKVIFYYKKIVGLMWGFVIVK